MRGWFATGTALCLAVLTGCGIQPSRVIDAGAPAPGPSNGMRVYFLQGDRLVGVERPTDQITDLDSALVMLFAEPSDEERRQGMRTEVHVSGPASEWKPDVTADGPDIRLALPRVKMLTRGLDQVTCTLARAQHVLHPEIRPEQVSVTLLDKTGTPTGPYRCSTVG